MRSLLTVLIFLILVEPGNAQTTQVLDQQEAPISITSFRAKYQEGGSYTSEGIRYDVKFSNASGTPIVAYAMGFYAFDVFNRSLGRPLEGFSVDDLPENGSNKAAWIQRTSNSSLFKKYGTAVAYIARVRFGNGSIWSYDAASILEQLQVFESSLTLDDLRTSKE